MILDRADMMDSATVRDVQRVLTRLSLSALGSYVCDLPSYLLICLPDLKVESRNPIRSMGYSSTAPV